MTDYWDFLQQYDGIAIDQGGEGAARVEVVDPAALWEPLIWPAGDANPARLEALDLPFASDTFCFGELEGSGYLYFQRSRVGIFRRVRVEVRFFDYGEPNQPSTRLAASFDEFLVRLVDHGLKLTNLLEECGAAGWTSDLERPAPHLRLPDQGK